MKKILSILGAAAVLTVAASLVGCSDPVSGATDTIRTIEAPVLSTETFPGVNYISWNKVNGAESYVVYRDGNVVATINSSSKILEYADVAYAGTSSIADGVSYEYTVKAVPAAGWFADESGAQSGNGSRAVYSEEAQASVTLTANVPTAAEFAESYASYFESFGGEDPAFKTEFVAADTDKTDYVRFTLPAKPEFKYEIYKYLDNAPDKYENKVFEWNLYKAAAGSREFLAPVTGAGDWNYIVKVAPRAPIYTSKEFAASAKVAVTALNVSSASAISATYIDAGKTVKIKWNPAKDATGKEFAAASYSVYRFADNAWTKLGEVSTEKNYYGNTVYFVKDEVADSKVNNDYFVVLSEGKAYAKEARVTAYAYGVDATVNNAATNVAAEYIDAGKTVRITWQPVKNAANTAYGVDSYAVYRKDVGINGVETFTQLTGKITASSGSYINYSSTWNNGTTTYSYTLVSSPSGNPARQGWYEFNATTFEYVRTHDSTVLTGKEYFTQTSSTSAGSSSSSGDHRYNTQDVYYITDEPKDNTIGYNYIVVLCGVKENWTWVNAYSLRTNPSYPTINANKFAKEQTDTYQNDVYVTVTPGKSTDTYKLYRRTVSDANGTRINNVVAEDWTELTGLTGPNTSGAYVYVDANLAEGIYEYKAVESAKDYADSAATTQVTINSRGNVATTNLHLNVTKYLAESLGAGRTSAKFSISVTDTINSNEAAKYTYKVQYSKVEDVDPSSTTTSYSFGAWTDIATLAMVDTSTASLYSGATNITLGKGVYYFRVIKTDSNIAESKCVYAGTYSVDAGYYTSNIGLSTTTAGTQVAITSSTSYYGNYTVKLYRQQNINYSATNDTNNRVSDFVQVTPTAFSPIVAGSSTYQATYGTYNSTSSGTLEAVTYNYLLVVTNPEGEKTYSTLNNVYIY